LKDHIAPGVRVLFVGINPGIRSALTGHHFAGYSNRFWKLLYDSGLVPEPITTEEDWRLPEWGYGITNLIPRATTGIGELRRDEYERGRARLLAKIRQHRPAVVALVGVTLARTLLPGMESQTARRDGDPIPGRLGLQPARLAGADVFVLPNPSGRNANFSYAEMLAAFVSLKEYLEKRSR
jgi:TDG/mug DNA glycosylase family protein